MAKKFGLKNKPVRIGDTDTKLSVLTEETKAELVQRLSHGEKKEYDQVDIMPYLPTEYRYETVPYDILEPAPDEWNFFTRPSKEKILALAESIYYNGLLQPIVVRELDDEGKRLQILAGHTRVEAYRILRETLGDPVYTRIPALVYSNSLLDDEEAKDIVCDTNFMQRGTLTPMETARCIALKAKRLRGDALRSKEPIADKIAAYYHMKRSSVFRWQRIANLIPELADLAETRQLTTVNMYKLAGFSPEEQKKIYRRAADYISNHSLKDIKAKHKVEDVIRIVKDDKAPDIPIHYFVSAELLNGRRPILILVDSMVYGDVLKKLKNNAKLILIE